MTEHTEHHHTLPYADAIRRYCADKDAYLRTGHASPVPAADRAAFPGIPYFPVDESFIAEGLVLEPYSGDDPVRFEIPTTDGRLRPAERAGVFHFEMLEPASPDRVPDGQRVAVRALHLVERQATDEDDGGSVRSAARIARAASSSVAR